MEPAGQQGTAGVIARPPRLFVAALLLGFVFDRLLPLPLAVPGTDLVHWMCPGAMILVGLALVTAGIRNFSRSATPVPTNQPTRVLVTTGIHRWTRNPIYLGMFLLYGGIGIAAASPWTLILTLPLAFTIRYGVVAREEVYLEGRFGDAYRDYRSRVRRWLPLSAAFLSLFLVVFLAGSGRTWTGFGFDANGPEMLRLQEALGLRAGMAVADVGAGKGQLTLALAAAVGRDGRVFSTEIDPERLRALRKTFAEAKLSNVTVVEAKASESGLQDNCCDAIVLRRVYHHLSDPAATNVDLIRAVRPGGVLAVIDFPPTLSWLWPWPPKGVPTNRNGHGVVAGLVVDEVTASGFELVKVIDDWPGRGPLESYCAVFRKPSTANDSRCPANN
jgi:protein-S-isoprenylcysteine O-methyltransferase Ste14